ncbi:hypothetical protein [Longitalea luteola]|uniref:hypothetical protein n=1 Tax=Longitalea luteola TaxID=2812563 RepID=UPI001A96D7B6|nr:hypothetical protein [Longitalea luteola]
MLHNIFLIAFLLTGFPVVAQKTVFSFQTSNVDSTKKSTCESFVVPDEKAGKTTIILKGNDNVEYLLLNREFEVEAKVLPANGLVNTIFGKRYEKYLAGVRNNLGSCFYYMIDRNHFSIEIVNFTNNSIVNKPIFDKADEERNIEWFTSEGRFYLLALNEKKGELALHIVDENGVVSHKNIAVDLSGYNPQKLTLSEYFSYSHVFYPGQETDLIESTELTKIYPYPDKIIMIVANYNEPPHIWTIDLQTYNVIKKKFDLSGFSGFVGNKEKIFNNTYLYGENLFVLNSSRQKIEVGIFNFKTGQLVQKHEITGSSEVQFIETPVEISTKGKLRKQNIIGSNKELIKELSKGTGGIAVARNNKGQIILTCGVYDKGMALYSYEYCPGGGFRAYSTPTGTFYAGPNIPLKRSYSDGAYTPGFKERYYSYTRTVNFKITLDSSEFRLVVAKEKLSNIDRINHYLKTLPEEAQAINTFKINKNDYFGYYSPKERTYFVKEMEK